MWTYWIVPTGAVDDPERPEQWAEGFAARGSGPAQGALMVTLSAKAARELVARVERHGRRTDGATERARQALRQLGCSVTRTYLEARSLHDADRPAVVVSLDASLERLELLATSLSIAPLAPGRRAEPPISMHVSESVMAVATSAVSAGQAASRVNHLALLLHQIDDQVVPAVRRLMNEPAVKTNLDLLRIALSEVGVMPSIPDALGAHRLPASLLRLTAATHELMSSARRLTFPVADDALTRLDRVVVDYERAAVWFDDRRDDGV